MIYVIIILIIVAGIAAYGRAKNKAGLAREQLMDLARAEGNTAWDMGKSEGDCPYHDDMEEPPNLPVGIAMVVNDGRPHGQRYWWLLAYRHARRAAQQSNASKRASQFFAQSQPDPKPSEPVQNSGEFLSPLSREEKRAVIGQNPQFYDAVILAKRSNQYSAMKSVSVGAPSEFPVGELLWKLDIGDIERLAESVRLSNQADKLAEMDATKASRLYQEAFKLNPFDDVVAMSYGVLMAKQGDLQEGIKWLERARELNPRSERIQRNLAAIKSYL